MIARLRRNALIACAAMALAATAIARSPWWGVAVAGGGLLIGVSFVAIASGVDTLAADKRPAFVLLKVIGRYALLGFLAYVMIARLRLPPLGLIAGACSFAVAAAFETVGIFRQKQ
jgi:hypothetical protein